MKKIILVSAVLSFFISNAQTSTPKNVILTINTIQGNSLFNTTVKIDVDSDDKADYTAIVNYLGKFEQVFDSALSKGDKVQIWAENPEGGESTKITLVAKSDSELLAEFTNGTTSLELEELSFSDVHKSNQLKKLALKNTTIKYKATIWNTNFSIPMARFNFTKDDDTDSKKGDLLLFSSIGAGFGFSMGELKRTRGNNGDLIDEEFTNTFGLHLGFLFSAGTGEDTSNVFAPTLNVSLLDFQLGLGYELGSISENQKRTFLTLSYAIPLYKLKKGSFWIWKGSKPIDDSNEIQGRQGGI